MTEAALEPRGNVDGSPAWVRRTVLVTFCVLLVATLGVVFTRVIAARVPEQRATLEKLITDRTGLAVRFDNVHFAWTLDGTSAVFERVELTDTRRGRVRVVAPELRVEFDTWDYLRHHQFSLGHVTLSSPDIEIIGDAIDAPKVTRSAPDGGASQPARQDEAALIRRFTAWAELMPNGRVEVEGARVHLIRRGDRAAHDTFTLSQAALSRDASSFNAFGTMLLSQDVGQSLFLSAKLEGLAAGAEVSGEMRVIARRVFLDKLPFVDARGRGTLDATVHLEKGLIRSASWQASVREFAIGDGAGGRFDHVTVLGKAERVAGDFLLKFDDLQLTRGARLERAPNISARLHMKPGTLLVARTTLSADRVPYMGAEFLAGLFAPQLRGHVTEFPGGWAPTAGVLRDLRFDSQGWTFSAQLAGAELVRASDRARIGQLAASLHFDADELRASFDPSSLASLRLAGSEEPRAFSLAGQIAVRNHREATSARFDAFDFRSGDSSLVANGEWNGNAPLVLRLAKVDRVSVRDAWSLLASEIETPALLAEIESGRVLDGTVSLSSARNAVDWPRSSGTLQLDALATSGKELPRIESGRGTLAFAKGGAQLKLDAGVLDRLALTSARLDWPRKGAPKLRVALQGDLTSPLLRRALEGSGLERLTGSITLEAEARGEKELRQPDLWRVSATLADASIPLGGDLPPLEKMAGTLRYGNGSLRNLALEGAWLGGPVEIESRRATTRGNLNVAINGVADAAQLLRLLGQPDLAGRVSGPLSWNGNAQHLGADDKDGWQLTLSSNLAGIESRLPEPFDKTRNRTLPVSAQLRVDAGGIHDFSVDARDLSIRGQVENGATTARFDLQGVEGELRRASANADPQLKFDRLDIKRAPVVLAIAGAVLPEGSELAMNVGDVRYAGRTFGELQATVARRDAGLEFSLESVDAAPHQFSAQGACVSGEARCRLDFTAGTERLATLLRGGQFPAEWPTEVLHASGELSWPSDAQEDLARVLTGRFDLETRGHTLGHQMTASATLADGQIELENVQGAGPEADQIFRGSGRVGLLARVYDLTIDYEKVSLAATAMPTPARARLARAWTALRGSAARRGWTEVPEPRRVQWRGSWDAED